MTWTDDAGASSGRAVVPQLGLDWALDVSYPDGQHGWIAASRPTPLLLDTTDGGATWRRVGLP